METLIISKTLANLPTIDYRELTDLQGNLKDLHQKEFDKLKKSLFGTEKKPKMFDFPLYVCNIEGTNYIFDGHQRLRVLKTLNAEPYELPCVFIEAKSLKEAKEKLLTLNSNYGKVTKDGFDEFIANDFELDFVKEFTTFDDFMDIDLAAEETVGEDEIPAEPKNIFVVRGDIFEIKANDVTIRVGCLDSTSSDDIEKLMAGQKRNCFTNDISENYVQISVKRIIDFCQANSFPFDITLNGQPFDTEKLSQ